MEWQEKDKKRYETFEKTRTETINMLKKHEGEDEGRWRLRYQEGLMFLMDRARYEYTSDLHECVCDIEVGGEVEIVIAIAALLRGSKYPRLALQAAELTLKGETNEADLIIQNWMKPCSATGQEPEEAIVR